VTAITCDYWGAAAATHDGRIVYWGIGADEKAGPKVPPGRHATALTMTDGSMLALLDDGTVVAAGGISSGAGTALENVRDALAIACGNTHGVVLRRGGTILSWGPKWASCWPKPQTVLQPLAAISATYDRTVAVTKDGTVMVWGRPRPPDGLCNVKAVSCGRHHVLALLDSGQVVAWGVNREGQCDVPVPIRAIRCLVAGGNTTGVIADPPPPSAAADPATQTKPQP
jgi:hypothetical protein